MSDRSCLRNMALRPRKLSIPDHIQRNLRAQLTNYLCTSRQSQYERQVRKWNLKKTHTGEEWAALSARCRNRIGKGSEFYYRGKLIDTQRAQRVLWRHGYISTIERVTYTQGRLNLLSSLEYVLIIPKSRTRLFLRVLLFELHPQSIS